MIREKVTPNGFSEHIEYVDVLGGHVIDSYRGNDRITCIVSRDLVQVLSYIDDCIESKEFTIRDGTVLETMEYISKLLE